MTIPGLRRIDHIGVIVADLANASHLLGGQLGLKRAGGTDTAAYRTAFYKCGDASIEVIEILDEEGRLKRLGVGVNARIEHIAIEVDDLRKTQHALQLVGIHANAPPRVSGDYRTFWTEPTTSNGLMLQFLEHEGHSSRE